MTFSKETVSCLPLGSGCHLVKCFNPKGWFSTPESKGVLLPASPKAAKKIAKVLLENKGKRL